MTPEERAQQDIDAIETMGLAWALRDRLAREASWLEPDLLREVLTTLYRMQEVDSARRVARQPELQALIEPELLARYAELRALHPESLPESVSVGWNQPADTKDW